MALHIQMSEEAEAQMRRRSLLSKLTSLMACFAFMGIGGSILYFTVILIGNIQTPAFETYVAPNEEAAATNKPKVKELTSKTTPTTSRVAPSVIVSTSAAAIAMAEVDLPTNDVEIGTSMEVDMGLGTGLGSSLGESGGGLGTTESGGSALEGTFYDIKLTRAGASTGIKFNENGWLAGNGREVVGTVIGEFIAKKWDPKVLEKYYKSPTKLYASNFLMPSSLASYAPTAFKADTKKVKPSGWVVVYRGKVKAPKTGKFRFIGNGDDFIAVRFNRNLVLEAGYLVATSYKPGQTSASFAGMSQGYNDAIATMPGHEGYKLYPQEGPCWTNNGALVGGNVFNVEEGKEYPIEILVSEIPGGTFNFILLLEDLSAPRTKNGRPVFDIFRTNYSLPNMTELEKELRSHGAFQTPDTTPFNEDSLIWTAVP